MATVSLNNPYKYMYGAGTENNREILFERKDGPETIFATVKGQFSGKWEVIGTVEGEDISVEMMTVSEKMDAIALEKAGNAVERKPDKLLAELTLDEQDSIIGNLKPKGTWSIEITNGIGGDTKFEKIVSLCLFNPI